MAKFTLNKNRNTPLCLSLAAVGLVTGAVLMTIQPASAQGLKHFYMARQQVQITDDAPLVNDQRTFPQGGQPGQGMGALPARPMALPRAGFQSYSSQMQSGPTTSLPQVVNGVPPKDPGPLPVKKGKSAKTGQLKVKADSKKPVSTAATKPPVTAAKAYSPYKGYNPGAAAQAPQQTAGASNMQSKTKVRGSVLHWARGH